MPNGRDVFCRAIERRDPAYTPSLIECSFEHFHERNPSKFDQIRRQIEALPDDLLKLDPRPTFPIAPHRGNDHALYWTDHWGTGWSDDGNGGKTIFHPLESDFAALDDYTIPNPVAAGDFDDADAALHNRGDRYVLGSVWFTLFERYWMLRGFDNALLDMYTDEARFERLRDAILDHALGRVDAWIARGVDGIFFSDDWGSQRGLLIDPEVWRERFKPCYRRLFERVKSGGAHVWMHLCGDIRAILPDLLELGLDVLNPVQPRAMDVHALACEFGGAVCFCGGADVQGVLIDGPAETVGGHVDELVALFGRYHGGCILSTSHGLMPETPLDHVIALYNAALYHAHRDCKE